MIMNPARPLTIQANSARCGHGKTTAIIKEAKRLYGMGESVLIVQPSILLIEETHRKLPESTPLHNENCDNVAQAIAFNAAQQNKPQILIITSVSFTSYAHDLSKYTLMIDEEIDPVAHHTFNLVETGMKLDLEQWYTLNESEHADYLKVDAADPVKLLNAIESKDDVVGIFKAINKAVLSPFHDVYLSSTAGDNFLNEEGVLMMHILLRKERFDNFKGIMFYGALIENSLMVTALGLDVKVVVPFLRHNATHLTVYGAKNTGWSKYANTHYKEIKDNFVNYFTDVIDGNDYIYLDNNNQGTQSGGTRIGHNPHGINSYIDMQNVVVMSAINPCAERKKFLSVVCGCDDLDIKRHMMGNLYYQTVLRTAIRVNGNTKKVNIFCLDGLVADFLLFEYFDDNVTYIEVPDTDVADVKKARKAIAPMSAYDRKRVCLMRKNYPVLSGVKSSDIIKGDVLSDVNSKGFLKKDIIIALNEMKHDETHYLRQILEIKK